MFYQQPDVYQFRKTDKTEYTTNLSSTIVEKKEYTGDGMNTVYFKSTASETDIVNIINIIIADPLFEKEFMVLTKDWNTEYSIKDFIPTCNKIEVLFNDPEISTSDVNTFATNYNLTLFYKSNYSGGIYIFEVNPIPEVSSYNDAKLAIERAAEIWENDMSIIKTVHPSLKIFEEYIPDDPYYDQSWHIENDGNILCNGDSGIIDADAKNNRVWNVNDEFGYGVGYTGQGIKIGVLETRGYQYSHPDLNGQLLPGWDGVNDTAFSNDIYISNLTEAHGQNVVGIMVAKTNNTEGVSGIAYNAQVYPTLHNFYTYSVAICFDKCFDANVDIINMSWGGILGLSNANWLAFNTTFENLYKKGRNNKGIILIASAGNDGNSQNSFPTEKTQVLTIGASNPKDQIKTSSDGFGSWYSTANYNLDVCAPGVCIPSTDYVGSDGYSTSSDYYLFKGTSASAPIVSGIAALLLEKDPTLSFEEVHSAIRNGCDKVGGYVYDPITGLSSEMAYGRVNAYKTVFETDINDYLSIKSLASSNYNISISNPIDDNLIININEKGYWKFEIFTLNGKTIQSDKLSNDRNVIDVSYLSKGIYFVKIFNNDLTISLTEKVIKH